MLGEWLRDTGRYCSIGTAPLTIRSLKLDNAWERPVEFCDTFARPAPRDPPCAVLQFSCIARFIGCYATNSITAPGTEHRDRPTLIKLFLTLRFHISNVIFITFVAISLANTRLCNNKRKNLINWIFHTIWAMYKSILRGSLCGECFMDALFAKLGTASPSPDDTHWPKILRLTRIPSCISII